MVRNMEEYENNETFKTETINSISFGLFFNITNLRV